MSLTDFWAHIDNQIDQLRTATTVDRVLEICPHIPDVASGQGFFAGSGGDQQLIDPLTQEAGWRVVWIDADYYFCLRSPDGSEELTYVEGDIYRGNTMPSKGT